MLLFGNVIYSNDIGSPLHKGVKNHTVVTLPIFASIPSSVICGSTPPILPTTSDNGIVGNWSPSTVNTSVPNYPSYTLYTFTPTNNIHDVVQIGITVFPGSRPFFYNLPTQINCGATAPILSTISDNGISGTWNPSVVSNSVDGLYTFTPNSGQCTFETYSFFLDVGTIPTFYSGDTVYSYCEYDFYNLPSTSLLPTTSNNGISGTWNVIVDEMPYFLCIFTPSSNQTCVTSTYLIVNFADCNSLVPEFSLPSYVNCGSTAPILPTISNNNIFGTWSPSVVSTSQTLTYTFTPSNSYIYPITTTINVLFTYPEFNQIGFGCAGDDTVPLVLPTTSNNGITGVWTPTLANPPVSGIYTFTPNVGQCAVSQYQLQINTYPYESSACVCNSSLVLSNPPNTPEYGLFNNFFRLNWIKTNNNFSLLNNQVLKLNAGDYIELLPNSVFETNQLFEAQIYDYCANPSDRIANALIDDVEISKKSLSIYPNPSSSFIEILLKNSTFNKVLINSIDGKTVLDKNIENSESFQVDVSNYANGLYIVNVIDKDGQVYNQKLIKN